MRWRFWGALVAICCLSAAPSRYVEVAGWMWNQDRRGAELRAFVDYDMPPRLVLQWHRQLKRPTRFSPVIDTTGVYVGFDDGTVAKLRLANGVLLWSVHPTKAAFGSSGAVTSFGGRPMFVAGAEDGVLYSLNASSGATLWTRGGGSTGTAVSPVTVARGGRLLYTVTIPGSSLLRELKTTDGSVIWERNVGRSTVTPLASDYTPAGSAPIDAVYQATAQTGPAGPVRVLRLDTGAPLGDVGPTGASSATETNAVLSLQRYTLVGTTQGRIGAYNAEQDLPVWQKNLGSTDQVTGIAAVSRTPQRIIVSQTKRLTALDELTGAELWHADHSGNGPPDPVNQRAPMPAIYGALVFSIEDFNHIVARDIANGAEVWNYRLDSRVAGSPALAPGGIVVVLSSNGTLYLFKFCR